MHFVCVTADVWFLNYVFVHVFTFSASGIWVCFVVCCGSAFDCVSEWRFVNHQSFGLKGNRFCMLLSRLMMLRLMISQRITQNFILSKFRSASFHGSLPDISSTSVSAKLKMLIRSLWKIFRGTSHTEVYETTMEFFDEINGEGMKRTPTNTRVIELTIPKKESKWWPRLLKEKGKVSL